MDTRTIVFSYGISNAVCAVVMALLWIRNRRHFAGLGFWLADFALQFTATTLAPLRGILPDFVSMAMPNILVSAGTILMLMGLERFVGKPASHLHNYILLAAFSGIHIFVTLIQPDTLLRVINFSLALILVLVQSAWLMLRRADADLRPITRGVGYVFVTACLLAILRPITVLFARPVNDFSQPGVNDALYILANQMLFIVLTFSLFLMVNRRLVASLESDIEAHEQAKRALHASETLFRQMFTEHSAVKLLIDPANLNIMDANPAAARFYGYPIEKLLQMNMTQINTLAPAEIESALQDARQYKRNYFVFQHRLASGKLRDVEVHSAPIQVNERQLLYSIIHDITERNALETLLRRRGDMLAALQQTIFDLINRHEMDDILQTLLIKIGALIDAPDVSIDLVENNDTLVTHAVSSNQPLKRGDTMRRGEGGWLSWQAVDSGQPVVLEDYSTWSKRRPLYEGYPIHAIMVIPIQQREQVIGAISISRSEADQPFNDTDVYVAKQLAQIVALILDNAQLYAQLQSELVESVRREGALHEAQAQVIEQQRTMATIDERQRMARELHDSVNQSIHSLMLFSETLVSMLDRNNVERARQISERLQESARQALKETRLLLYQSQASVKEGGVNLIEELNARLANVELRAGVRAQIIQTGSLEHCPAAWHENLFWITIEALNNSLKHAQAHGVQIIIRCYPDSMTLEVIDDGRGFDITKPGAGGYGLRNMQERADSLGGRLTVTSSPEAGTIVSFRAEIKEQT